MKTRKYKQEIDLMVVAAALFLAIGLLIMAAGQRTAESAVKVCSEPAASVWIDGVLQGRTDDNGELSIPFVAPGRTKLTIRKYGFQNYVGPVVRQQSCKRISLTETTDAAELAFQDAERSTAIDRPKAAALYRKAISLRANYPEAYVGLARTEVELGNIEAAFAAIKSALRLRPVYPEASAVEGRLLKDTGESAKAIAAFKRAITQGGGYQPEAYTGLGMLYQERAEEAIGNGEIAAAERDYEEAAKNFAQAIKQLGASPDVGVIVQMLGRIYEHRKEYKEAIALYKDFLAKFPDAIEASAVRSFIVQLEKQMSEN